MMYPQHVSKERPDRFEIGASVRLALSAAGGLLLALAFPKFELAGFAWFALVPLLFAINRSRLSSVFMCSWLHGFVFFVLVLYPIPIALITFGHSSLVAALVKLLLLSAFEALSIGAALTVAKLMTSRLGLPDLVVLPVAWVGFELLRTYVPVGFPWALLGYAAYRDVRLIQFAEYTGIYGVSALIVIVNVTVYRVLTSAQTFKATLLQAAPAFSLLCVALLFGTLRLSQLRATAPAGTLRVAFVQANIPQSLKWEQSNVEPTLQVYTQETLKAAKQHPDLVIWPETAAPFAFIDPSLYGIFEVHRRYHDWLVKFIRDAHQPLLFGAPALDFYNGISTRNRVNLVSADGSLVGYYDKMMLVPFDEYIPMAHFLGRFIDKPVESIGPITPGTQQTVLKVKDARLGVLICYESIFPSLARNSVRAGANVLVNLSNDAWFGATSAPYQLLAMAAMRTVENRVIMLRVANTGISAVIKPTGEIVSATKLDTRVTETQTVSWISPGTFYTRHGDLFAEFCAVATAMGLFFALAFRRSK